MSTQSFKLILKTAYWLGVTGFVGSIVGLYFNLGQGNYGMACLGVLGIGLGLYSFTTIGRMLDTMQAVEDAIRYGMLYEALKTAGKVPPIPTIPKGPHGHA